MSPDLDARLRPASRVPGSGCLSMRLKPRGSTDGMQVLVTLLNVIAFMVVLVVVIGMALAPWLVDGAL